MGMAYRWQADLCISIRDCYDTVFCSDNTGGTAYGLLFPEPLCAEQKEAYIYNCIGKYDYNGYSSGLRTLDLRG
jgi:hypothetical protein